MYIARHQWITPVILATWEAEIRRITVQDQSGQMIYESLPPSSKTNQYKRDWRWTQVVECLHCKSKAKFKPQLHHTHTKKV
jgi:hypothetical protein